MWISSEDARSDFILAAAAVFLGGQAATLIGQIPGYPRAGIAALVLSNIWLILIGCGAAYGLARHRGDLAAAFALDPPNRGSAGAGIVLATPLVVAHVTTVLLGADWSDSFRAFAGRLSTSTALGISTPALQAPPGQFSLEGILLLVAVITIAVGSWLTVTLLSVRARDAFRSPDMDLTGLLRTFGLGGAGVVLVLGQMVAVATSASFAAMLLLAIALAIIVLLADQYVPANVPVPRAALLGPAIAVLVLWVIAFGGPFRGNLLLGLFAGVASGVLTLVASAMVQARHGLAAGILLAASAIYPIGGMLIQPLPLRLIMP
jgi:hypothetical protein